jgi:hypothetical protein
VCQRAYALASIRLVRSHEAEWLATYRNGGSPTITNMVIADVEVDEVYKRLEDIG